MEIIDRSSDGLGNHYPTSWAKIIGQERAKRDLQVRAKAAKARRTVAPPVLMASSLPGVGRTAMGLQLLRDTRVRTLAVISGEGLDAVSIRPLVGMLARVSRRAARRRDLAAMEVGLNSRRECRRTSCRSR